MKKILFPTDFSPCAEGALDFALALAKAGRASLSVCHIYHSLVSAMPELEMQMEPDQETKMSMEKLKARIGRHRMPADQLRFEFLPGFAVDGILLATETEKADLVVMGTRGASGSGNWLLGSITGEVIDKATMPVLCIPEGCKYSGIKKIMYAADARSEDFAAISQLKELVRKFGARLEIVHVQTPQQMISDDGFEKFQTDVCKGFNYDQLHFELIESDSVANGIASWARQHKPDLLAILQHKRNFLRKIFDPSLTKKIALHFNIPLLAFKN